MQPAHTAPRRPGPPSILLAAFASLAMASCHSPTEPSPSPTPSAIPTLTPAPLPTSTPSPTATPRPAASPTPTATPPPSTPDLSGTWRGSATYWPTLVMTLVQVGRTVSGEVFFPHGTHYPVTSTDGVHLAVKVDSPICSLGFAIDRKDYDASGNLVGFSGGLHGRCPSTIVGSFAFLRTRTF